MATRLKTARTLRSLVAVAALVSCCAASAQDYNPMSGLASDAAATTSAAATRAKNRAACHTIQAELARALLRFNITNNTKVDTLNSTVGTRLVKDSYLSKLPDDPGSGRGTFRNYRFMSGRLTCAVHGPVAVSRLPSEKTVQKILKNACYLVQFKLATALLRYNIRNNLRVERLNFDVGSRMVMQGLLPYLPDDPGSGKGTFRNYTHSSPSYPGITCIRHGRAPTP
ncbi:MAG: hypothetical protein HY814_10180 [Candidatus Riflebacteria bacterium]|nr:hypothetical protein [Candidatus Riflebacteria bacterium]